MFCNPVSARIRLKRNTPTFVCFVLNSDIYFYTLCVTGLFFFHFHIGHVFPEFKESDAMFAAERVRYFVFLDSLKQSYYYKTDDLYLAERMWLSRYNISVLTCGVCLLCPGSRLG